MYATNKNDFDLGRIAAYLEGLEETIIYKLIDRAQFAHNPSSYKPGKSGFNGGGDQSLFELRLTRVEAMDSEFGRYQVPEERPFSRQLPEPKRIVSLPETGLCVPDFNVVNMSREIFKAYIALVPEICIPGSDGQLGSSVEHDVHAFQAIARRVHFGALYVSESKYRSDPETYAALAADQDIEGLKRLLTRAEVEESILERVADKVEHVQSQINPAVRRHIPSSSVMTFYRNYVIPLTKEGEVRYFLNRKR
jgi:chorismate mutase